MTLTRPDGVVEHYGISIGSDGTGSYTFTGTSNVITGTYSATLTNPATGAHAEASVEVESAAGTPSSTTPGTDDTDIHDTRLDRPSVDHAGADDSGTDDTGG